MNNPNTNKNNYSTLHNKMLNNYQIRNNKNNIKNGNNIL